MMIPLSKMLKFRLPTWKDEKYWKWCSSQRIDGYEWHHLLGRRYCDFLLVNIPKTQHDRIHHGTGYEDGEYETLFLACLINLMRYIKERNER